MVSAPPVRRRLCLLFLLGTWADVPEVTVARTVIALRSGDHQSRDPGRQHQAGGNALRRRLCGNTRR
jgi:hypothetical protein